MKKQCARRLSPANAGCRTGVQNAYPVLRVPRMRERKVESGYAQRLSNDSELFENLESVMLNGHIKTRNGWGMGHIGQNDSSHVQRLSNGSECGKTCRNGAKNVKEREKWKAVMLNGYPMTRSCLKILKALCSTAIQIVQNEERDLFVPCQLSG